MIGKNVSGPYTAQRLRDAMKRLKVREKKVEGVAPGGERIARIKAFLKAKKPS